MPIFVYTKKETKQLNIKVMVKNGIIAKMSTVEGTLSERDKAMFRGTTYVCSDDKKDLYVTFKSTYDFGKFLKNTPKIDLEKAYVCYFYAHLINGKVIRTKDMPRYLVGGNN
jgi:hypothetical protein